MSFLADARSFAFVRSAFFVSAMNLLPPFSTHGQFFYSIEQKEIFFNKKSIISHKKMKFLISAASGVSQGLLPAVF